MVEFTGDVGRVGAMCSGGITTNDEKIMSVWDNHNHPTDNIDCEVQKVVYKMHEQARRTVRLIPAIYQESIQALSTANNNREEVASKLHTLLQVKSALYQSRRKKLPPLPASTRRSSH